MFSLDFLSLSYNFSACCHVDKIYGLVEGIRFLDKYKNRKTGFSKAVKEMASVMKNTQSQVRRTRQNNRAIDEMLQPYLSF